MKKILFVLLLLICGCGHLNPIILPIEITDLKSYSTYLYNNIEYKEDTEDYWQMPEETLKLKAGDCEDYAIFNKEVLTQLGIKSKMYVLYFKKNKESSHVVCVYQIDNKFKMIDNQYFYSVKSSNPIKLCLFYYSDIESIYEFNPVKYGKSNRFIRGLSIKQVYPNKNLF